MKTLLFCTSWSDSELTWRHRYGTWLAQVRDSRLQYDRLLMIDDASPLLPDFERLVVVKADDVHSSDFPRETAVLVRFPNRLGQTGRNSFPGWWRSFMFAGEYAVRHSFERIIHIESDTFVLSNALADYIDRIRSGWVALWCPRHAFPETCIQVICEDQFASYRSLEKHDYASQYAGGAIEKKLPFTQVEKCFKGDRYGEYRTDLPLDADYACQVRKSISVWFGTPPAPKRVLAASVGENVIPPHRTLYPGDAWSCVGNITCRDFPSLTHEVARLPAGTLDAIQVTVLSAGANAVMIPFDILQRALLPGGELVIQLRPTVGMDVFTKMVDACGQSGMRDRVGKVGEPARGDLLVAIRSDTPLEAELRKERLLARRELA